MSTRTPSARTASSGAGSRSAAETTRRLLAAGIVAGPLFAVVAVGQILLRDGFDLSRHPISLLATGEHGWIQIANFVLAGGLVLLMARGLRRSLTTGRGSRWVPRLVGVFGIGLIASGVFVADPWNGFPAGTPVGQAAAMSWHGILHAAGAAIAYNALVAAMVVLAVRMAAHRRVGWATANAAAALTILALSAQPTQEGVSIRIAASAVVAFAWLAGLAWAMRPGSRNRAS